MGNEASSQKARTEEAALRSAAASGDAAAVETLLKQNPALVYAHSKAGENLWHLAAESGHPQVVQVVGGAVQEALLGQNKQERMMAQVGAAANNVNKAVTTFIAATTSAQLPGSLALPMGRNLDVNAPTREGRTPLMAAVAGGNLEVIKALLMAGADPWVGDAKGRTVLHHAATAGQGPVAQLLLAHVAEDEADSSPAECLVNAPSATGLTPLHCAAWAGHPDLVKLLVNTGATLGASTHLDSLGDISCNAGSTPLHLAAMKAEWPVVRLLLRASSKLAALQGAGAHELRLIADHYGKLAYDLAADLRRAELAEVLNPTTPLDLAIARTAGRPAERPTGANHHNTSSSSHQPTASGRNSEASGAQPQRGLSGSQLAQQLSKKAGNEEASGGMGGLIRAIRRSGSSTGGDSSAAADSALNERLRGMALQGGGGEGGSGGNGTPPPDHLVCPITNQLLVDPVQAADGRVYERDAIEVWFQLGNKQFPGGAATITTTATIARPDVAAEAAAWRAGQGQDQASS